MPRGGTALLEDPALNKGTAFTSEERVALDLDGLLPPAVETLEQQSRRCYEAFGRKQYDLERHCRLNGGLPAQPSELAAYKL